MSETETVFAALYKCPTHGFTALALENGDGGTRFTRGKCCGRWEVAKRWPLTLSDLRELSRLADEYAEALEEEPNAE